MEGEAHPETHAGPTPAAAPTGCAAGGGAELTGAGIDGVKIGQSTEELRRLCPVVGDTMLLLEGQSQPALKIALGGDTIVAEIVAGRIWRIDVTSPGLATRDSLRVGTPARRLAALPGARVAAGEGNYFVFVPSHCGLSFGLVGLPTRGRPWTIAELAAQPDSARVGVILVTGACHER